MALPLHPLDPHPVRPVLAQPDAVQAGGDIGSGVPGASGLVQQLRGDRADVHEAAGAGVLGDDAAAVGVDLGEREAGPPYVALLEERVVPAGGLGSALQHMPGDDGPGQLVELPGPQPKWAAAGPVTRAASVTRPVTTMSAPARRHAAMPNPPR